MLYVSTRNANVTATPSEALLQGIAPDGGLYVPQQLPQLQLRDEQLISKSYQEIAQIILSHFFPDFSAEEIAACVAKAYNAQNFDCEEMVAIQSFQQKHYLELFHGKTIAFKDMALSLLPHLMTVAATKTGNPAKRLILTATSGDTGKAALAGFEDDPNSRIIVFYPKQGVSDIQELQMVTQTGNNTHVVAINGNFDDAQSALKQLFVDAELQKLLNTKGYELSSANSINIGRLVPQMIYYVFGYYQLVAKQKITFGQPIHVAVPTGNFGNILAAFLAKKLGLPIQLLISASNKNNVLSDFFQTGEYRKNRPFYTTNAPSMDILVSSNLERLLYYAANENGNVVKNLMANLDTDGQYTIVENMLPTIKSFIGDYADEHTVSQHIFDVFKETGYLMDTHTAVASSVCDAYISATHDATPILIASTASPYKFPRFVLEKFNHDQSLSDFELLHTLEQLSNVPIPKSLQHLNSLPIRHKTVIEKNAIKETIIAILNEV